MMRALRAATAAALIASQALAPPALAAELFGSGEPVEVERGAFAGARLRVALGGRRDGEIRAGLALTPISLRRSSDGAVGRQFAEGFEFGGGQGAPFGLRLAGRPIGGGDRAAQSRRLGVSTLGAAAIVGGVIVAGFIGYALVSRSDD